MPPIHTKYPPVILRTPVSKHQAYALFAVSITFPIPVPPLQWIAFAESPRAFIIAPPCPEVCRLPPGGFMPVKGMDLLPLRTISSLPSGRKTLYTPQAACIPLVYIAKQDLQASVYRSFPCLCAPFDCHPAGGGIAFCCGYAMYSIATRMPHPGAACLFTHACKFCFPCRPPYSPSGTQRYLTAAGKSRIMARSGTLPGTSYSGIVLTRSPHDAYKFISLHRLVS